MCFVCPHCIKLYNSFKRPVFFDLLAFIGGGEVRKRAVDMVQRKATRKCSTVGAPWIDWRGCALFGRGLLGASYIVKEGIVTSINS